MRKKAIALILCLVSLFTLQSLPLNYTGIKFSNYAYTKRGNIGESFTDSSYFKRLGSGWTNISPRTAPQGLDHLYIKFEDGIPTDILVADSKFSNKKNPLNKATGQMSDLWISERLETIIPFYDINSDISYKIPSSSTLKYSVDGDSYIFWENGRCYYHSKSGKIQSPDYIAYKTREMRRYLVGAVEGRESIRKRLIQYTWENDELYEIVYSVKTENGFVKIDEPPLEKRIVSSLDEIDEELLNNQIKDLLSVYKYNNMDFVETLTDSEKIQLISMKKLSKETFNKIYNSSDETRALINKELGINSKKSVKGLERISDEKRAQIINGEVSSTDPALKSIVVRYHISQAVRTGFISAAIQSTITLGISITSQLSSSGEIDWDSTLNQTAFSAGIGFVSGFSSYFASYAGEKIAARIIGKQITKTTAKTFANGAIKATLPSVIGFAVGVGIDYFSTLSLSPELQKAIMKRSLLINGISLGVGILAGGATELITAGTSTAALAWIITGVEFATSLALEIVIPVPDEINPKVIRAQYANNPSIVENWAIENWNNRLSLNLSLKN